MAVCSSVLLFADNTIEYKIDWLYQWITIAQNADAFDFRQFFVAMSSFERYVCMYIGCVCVYMHVYMHVCVPMQYH